MTDNLFSLPEQPRTEELINVLEENAVVRIERIVSCGQTSDWYDQDESEFVTLLQGEAELCWEDGSKTRLHAGDALTIPPHQLHRVSFTSSEPPCIWLCVFWG